MFATFLRFVKNDKGEFVNNKFIALPKNGIEREFEVSPTCLCFINGKEAMHNELKSGDELTIDGQPAVRIEAARE